MRASEQIRMNLGYMQHGVNLVALGSGVGMGYLGNSHFGLGGPFRNESYSKFKNFITS